MGDISLLQLFRHEPDAGRPDVPVRAFDHVRARALGGTSAARRGRSDDILGPPCASAKLEGARRTPRSPGAQKHPSSVAQVVAYGLDALGQLAQGLRRS